jgi:uncharacterized protein YjbI with pentapeptide repeats
VEWDEMRLATATTIALLTFVGTVAPVYAQSSPGVEQLLARRACRGCDLSNANLKGLDLSKVDLREANLSNADLSGANLTDADLSGANLYLAKFQNSLLKGANLTGFKAKAAKFDGADLTSSNLTGADLTYAELPGANLSTADLSGANFSDANLTQANLTNAKLVGTSFSHANLSKVNLSATDLSKAKLLATDLTEANLSSGKLIGTDLSGANLTSANLSGADLTGANLETANLKNANFINANLAQTAQTKSGETGIGGGETVANPKTQDSTIVSSTQFEAKDSPLAHRSFQRPTAEHLKQGEIVLLLNERTFLTTSFGTGTTKKNGTPSWPSVVARWGITDRTEIGVALQNFDPNGIGRLGAFNYFINDSTPTWDVGVEIKQKIWENKSKTQALSGVLSVAGLTEPQFRFDSPATGTIIKKGNGIVPELSFPFTTKFNDRLSVTVSPTLALFSEENALFLNRTPVANSGSFGPTFGLTGAISYQVSPRVLLWGDAFFPFTGNNSLSRNTGLPTKTLAFNAGLRFLVNPRVGIDLFATNTFGNFGPISLTADRENIGIGAGLVFMPSVIPGNRDHYPDNFQGKFQKKDTPLTTDGLGFFDGGTVPANKTLLQFQGGSGGIMAAVRYGVVRDLEIGAYLDYVFGKVDESEQGVSGKVRLLNQGDGAPFTASAVVTFAQVNKPVINFINNDRDLFANGGGDKPFPFLFSGGLNKGNAFYLVTASLPLQYQFRPGTAVWLTPTLGFIQRGGLGVAGVNAGGSIRVYKDISLLAEVGANFTGDGNVFINNRLADRIPWNFAVRWTPSKLLGLDYTDALARPSLELFVTNRVGASAWHQFRVRDQNDPAVGVGVNFPF